MADALVSVVIVAYNNWPALELAIQSALCQSYKCLEVIVIDNSSTDGTPHQVARVFGDRVRYVRQPNSGDAGAYNSGMGLARGEFVQFLDGDDVLAPYKVERQMEIFRTQPDADFVYGDVRQFQERAGRALLKDTDTVEERDPLEAFLKASGDYFGNTLCFLIRRSALSRVGAWDEGIYVTDADYWLRALSAGMVFRNCPDALMGFVCVGPQKMAANATRMLRGQERLWLKALGLVEGEHHRTLVLQNLARVRTMMALRADDLPVRERIAKLGQARREAGAAVSYGAYVLSVTALLLPGGRTLLHGDSFRTLRHAIAKAVNFRPHP